MEIADAIRDGMPQHPPANRDNQLVSSGHRDKLCWGNKAIKRVLAQDNASNPLRETVLSETISWYEAETPKAQQPACCYSPTALLPLHACLEGTLHDRALPSVLLDTLLCQRYAGGPPVGYAVVLRATLMLAVVNTRTCPD